MARRTKLILDSDGWNGQDEPLELRIEAAPGRQARFGPHPKCLGRGALEVGDRPEPVDRSEDVLAVDEALRMLASSDPRKGCLVELRFFGGLTNEEAAAVLGISERTAKRDWMYTKAWLHREMTKAKDA